ncbi:NADPH-dependent FMN reductase [Paenibacillus sp. GCM10023248]|uniref:NADPH-dependent FMN reductase n=1 Tax=Bacillales TaxID=1385 RepID=UPI00237922BA|nr:MULTISPECIES: NADPH-dependent FMN reductase [Bacillales]MDD9266264.1 NAD(P)H-dependent oxidoreductase [Paenibacillus sp. MAHUQ-63]MDR6878385.1 NAD(P)H-dependent FMN reductase [Bacillus sp. 3255]
MKIALLAGSNHRAATSTKLAAYIQHLINANGHVSTLIDLYQTPVPFYSPENAHGGHEALEHLKRTMLEADGIVLATPEYHSGISGVLKNALDHLGQDHFHNKAVLSVSSSGGAIAVSSLTQLQTIVRNLHGVNSPEWISIGGDARKSFQPGAAFDDINPDVDLRVRRVVSSFLDLTSLLSVRQ